MACLRKYTLTSVYVILLAGFLQAQTPPSNTPKPLPGPAQDAAAVAAGVPSSGSSMASPYYPYGCYYYGSNSYGDLPNAQACSNSNGNQPNGNLQLHNSASMNYDNNTGTFLASSNTGNSASGDAASISSYTSANAYSPANPSPISEAQISGSANSNGQAATGNLNNLDHSNSANTPGGNAAHSSDSQINGTGTGVNLYSNAQANGQAYNYVTSTYPPKGAARNDKKIFFEPNSNVRARGSARQKATGTGKQKAAIARNPLTRHRTAGQASSQVQKSLSLNPNQNRRIQRQ